jgi:GNAT superfamily N-acetyltransferase
VSENTAGTAREGSLDAPTRHPIGWQSPGYWDAGALDREVERVFDICHGCRRCFSLCNAFPVLFDRVDSTPTGEVASVPREARWEVVDHCYLCDMCYMSKCPYGPPHEWNVDFPHLMLRAKAGRLKDRGASVRWHPTVPEDWQELDEGWSELADEKDWTVWLALDNDQALGTVGFTDQPEADADMLASPSTASLSVAATKPQARGRGISTFLTWHGLDRAKNDGYKICYTNWISPNLLASRFWPRFGFTDVAYRVAKKVSPMIAWAKDE